jgi:hypothetical protein
MTSAEQVIQALLPRPQAREALEALDLTQVEQQRVLVRTERFQPFLDRLFITEQAAAAADGELLAGPAETPVEVRAVH